MRRRARLLRALAVAGALAACGERGEPGRHVVLILLDTARADRVSTYEPARRTSPQLDRLAERGAVFLNHVSQSTDTRSALPRMLYSRYFTPPLFPLSARVPFSHPSDLFRRHDPEAISLPAVLEAGGLHSVMISAHTWLKPDTAFTREFDEVHDLSETLRLQEGYPHPRAEAVIDFTLDWLDAHRERDVFLYLHLMDNHAPRVFAEDAAALFEGDGARWMGTVCEELRSADSRDPEARAVLDAIYDGSVRYVDRHLGRLFDRYREWEMLDDTPIVVTSDHGEHLLERPGDFGHGGPWLDRVARIPLIVSYPSRLRPRRSSIPSELVDVAPTLLGLLDLELPREKSFDGVDLFSDAAAARAESVGPRAIRTAEHKVIFVTPDATLLAAEPPDLGRLSGRLHDLDRDPDELHDLWDERPEVVADALARYRARLTAPWARYRATRTERQPRSAFAIAARHFRTEERVPAIGERTGPAVRHGWMRSDHWRSSFLQALPGAPPLGFEIDLPSGLYGVTAALSGSCRVTLGDGAAREVVAAAGDAPVRLGEVEVRGHRLSAAIAPGTGDAPPCSVSYLGFVPAGAADPDPERDERLRALGYIN